MTAMMVVTTVEILSTIAYTAAFQTSCSDLHNICTPPWDQRSCWAHVQVLGWELLRAHFPQVLRPSLFLSDVQCSRE